MVGRSGKEDFCSQNKKEKMLPVVVHGEMPERRGERVLELSERKKKKVLGLGERKEGEAAKLGVRTGEKVSQLGVVAVGGVALRVVVVVVVVIYLDR